MRAVIGNGVIRQLCVAALVATSTASARAAVLFELQDSGTSMAWAEDVNTFMLVATNTGDQAIDLAGITLGLQILPQGLATGTATITAVGPPGTESPWIDPGTAGPSQESLVNGAVNGSSGYYLFSISENDLQNFSTVASGSSVNLAAVTVTTSANTRGLWALFAVTETDDLGNVVSFFSDPDFNNDQFLDLTAPVYPDAGSATRLQSIQYVPEPSASALAIAGAGVIAGLAAARRRRRAAC